MGMGSSITFDRLVDPRWWWRKYLKSQYNSKDRHLNEGIQNMSAWPYIYGYPFTIPPCCQLCQDIYFLNMWIILKFKHEYFTMEYDLFPSKFDKDLSSTMETLGKRDFVRFEPKTIPVKEGCPHCSKTVRSTSTSYHHLIGLGEIHLSEHGHQIASKSNLAGFPNGLHRHKMCRVTLWTPRCGDQTSIRPQVMEPCEAPYECTFGRICIKMTESNSICEK